ncbi:MAG: ribosome maturation factor RimM [Hyphomicrobiales bacterium]
MNTADCFYFGRLTKPHGMDGEVNFVLDVDDSSQYHELSMVLLDTRTGLIPFFIEEMNLRGNKGFIKFQDISSLDKAEELAGCELYLPLSVLPKLSGNKFYFHEVKGFKITDEKYGEVGVIDDILEYPNQAIFQVNDGSHEILIPISDNIIKKVDRETKNIDIIAPEGLIDIYL